MSKEIDITGRIFGELIVLKPTDKKKGFWDCKCSCGNIGSFRKDYITYVRNKTPKCRECSGYSKRQRNKDNDFYAGSKHVISSYKTKAKARGLPFNLTEDEFIKIIKDDCYYCGSPPSNIVKIFSGGKIQPGRVIIYNGIDRVDNSKGYILNNCVTCCRICNAAKGDKTTEQFKNWIKKVYLNQYKKYIDITPGQLIDQLFTVNMKCWWAQEKINDMSLPESERLKAATQAQEYNAKRNKLIRTIDYVLGFSEDTVTDKTYG